MTSEATIGTATATPGAASRPAIRNAGRVLGVAGLLGIAGLSLGDDAVPDLLRALPALDARRATFLETDLAARLSQLRNEAGLNAWQAWNAGRSAARDALEAARAAGDLP